MYSLRMTWIGEGVQFVQLIAWFWVQFGINSTSEWLLFVRGEAECNYANQSAINPKLYEKTCYWLLIINLAKLTVHYNKYEYVGIGKFMVFMVYNFTVYIR